MHKSRSYLTGLSVVIRVAISILCFYIAPSSVYCADTYIESWDELPRYGLLHPESHDMKSAKRFIVLAIQATPFLKGAWWPAHGLLGVSRLPTGADSVYVTSAYESLFRLPGNLQTTMETVATHHHASLIFFDLLGFGSSEVGGPSPSESWVYKRQRFLGAIGYLLHSRFRYDPKGNFGSVLAPSPQHGNSLELNKILPGAIKFYEELGDRGFDDVTLGDAIGMAIATLEYDGIFVGISAPSLPFAPRIDSDMLIDILQDLKRGDDFYNALAVRMTERRLNRDDAITSPRTAEQAEIVVRMIKEDLDAFGIRVKRAASAHQDRSGSKPDTGVAGPKRSFSDRWKATLDIWRK